MGCLGTTHCRASLFVCCCQGSVRVAGLVRPSSTKFARSAMSPFFVGCSSLTAWSAGAVGSNACWAPVVHWTISCKAAVSACAAVCSCEKSGQLLLALEPLAEMMYGRIHRGIFKYSAAVSCCVQGVGVTGYVALDGRYATSGVHVWAAVWCQAWWVRASSRAVQRSARSVGHHIFQCSRHLARAVRR